MLEHKGEVTREKMFPMFVFFLTRDKGRLIHCQYLSWYYHDWSKEKETKGNATSTL